MPPPAAASTGAVREKTPAPAQAVEIDIASLPGGSKSRSKLSMEARERAQRQSSVAASVASATTTASRARTPGAGGGGRSSGSQRPSTSNNSAAGSSSSGAKKDKDAEEESDDLRRRAKLRGLLNTSNLPALQNLLKRDPASYEDDFRAQWNHYQSLSRLIKSDMGISSGSAGASASGAGASGSSSAADATGASAAAAAAAAVAASGGATAGMRMSKEEHNRFLGVLNFVTQLTPSYPHITAGFPSELSNLLLHHHSALTPDLRLACTKSLVLLRNKEFIQSEELLRTLLPLLSLTTSSDLRKLVQRTILSDLKTANLRTRNVKLNRLVQGWLFSLIQKGIEAGKAVGGGMGAEGNNVKGKVAAENKMKSEALWAVRLAAELWRKHIWREAKTVQLLAEGCFHPHPKVSSSCIRFFLGDLHASEHAGAGDSDDGGANDSGEDSDETKAVAPDMSKLKHQRKVNKKTRGGDRKIRAEASKARKMAKAKRLARAGDAEVDAAAGGMTNAAALDLLNDPQGFSERLFEMLRVGDKRMQIELKVRIMQLLSRVMSLNKSVVLGFYSFIVKYLAPHQLHVTLILVSLAQSVHAQTPPDVLVPLVRKLSDAFIHPGVGPEVIAAGLNTVREICRRQPLVMEGESDLLEDLVAYRKSKDKGVIAGARGILALYREVHPELLRKRERGKAATMAAIAGQPVASAARFGVDTSEVKGIQGLDLLAKHLEEEGDDGEEDDEEAGWKDWELESDSDSDEDSDDSGGWIDVSSDEDGEDGFDISDSDDEKEDENGKPKISKKERAAAWKAKRRADKEKAKAGLPTAADEEADEALKAKREARRQEAELAAAKAQAEEDAMTKLATTRVS